MYKINSYLNRFKYEHEKSPLPIESSLIKKEEGEKRVLFGLRGQGKLDFIQRCIDDKMGWNQIAKSIGWINYAVFQDFYNEIYHDQFESIGVTLCDVENTPNKGWGIYDQETSKIIINEINGEYESIFFRNPTIKTIQFLIKDKEKFNVSNTTISDFYLIMDNEPTNIIYHSYLKLNNEEILLKNQNYFNLIIEIEKYTSKGYIFDKIYFDLINISNDKKCYVRNKFSNSILNILEN